MTDTEPKAADGAAAASPAEAAGPEANEAPRPDQVEVSEEAAHEEAMEQLGGHSPEVERLEAEKADLTDRLLRLAADMDNLRRRTERDVSDARRYAVAKFAGDMLVVADNLRRALDALPADARQSADGGFKALLEGVDMTAREMDRLLEKNGVIRIAAKGERFDPNRHQAMFEVADPSVPAGTVVQVVQEGYMIGDRVLRAAMVGVSKDGPAAESATESAPDEQASA